MNSEREVNGVVARMSVERENWITPVYEKASVSVMGYM